MTASIDSLVTPGDIARILREPLHRVDYILNTRQGIRPMRRAGIVRLFGPEAVDEVRQEITAINAKRAGRTEHDLGLALPSKAPRIGLNG